MKNNLIILKSVEFLHVDQYTFAVVKGASDIAEAVFAVAMELAKLSEFVIIPQGKSHLVSQKDDVVEFYPESVGMILVPFNDRYNIVMDKLFSDNPDQEEFDQDAHNNAEACANANH